MLSYGMAMVLLMLLLLMLAPVCMSLPYIWQVGGGVFNNKNQWIADAIARAIAYVSLFVDTKLEVIGWVGDWLIG